MIFTVLTSSLLSFTQLWLNNFARMCSRYSLFGDVVCLLGRGNWTKDWPVYLHFHEPEDIKKSLKCYLSLHGKCIKNALGLWAPQGRRSPAGWQNSFWKAFLTHRSILTVPLFFQGMRKYWTKEEKVWKNRINALLYFCLCEGEGDKPLCCPISIWLCRPCLLLSHNNSSCLLLISMRDQEAGRPASE